MNQPPENGRNNLSDEGQNNIIAQALAALANLMGTEMKILLNGQKDLILHT